MYLLRCLLVVYSFIIYSDALTVYKTLIKQTSLHIMLIQFVKCHYHISRGLDATWTTISISGKEEENSIKVSPVVAHVVFSGMLEEKDKEKNNGSAGWPVREESKHGPGGWGLCHSSRAEGEGECACVCVHVSVEKRVVAREIKRNKEAGPCQ